MKGTTIIDAKLVSDGDDLLEYAGRILGKSYKSQEKEKSVIAKIERFLNTVDVYEEL